MKGFPGINFVMGFNKLHLCKAIGQQANVSETKRFKTS